MNHKHKIIVISFDGLGTDDWKTVSKMPGFARFMKEAAYCDQVKSVYPTLTYPAHCSIATGRLPVNHRVVQNLLLQPNGWLRRIGIGNAVMCRVRPSMRRQKKRD